MWSDSIKNALRVFNENCAWWTRDSQVDSLRGRHKKGEGEGGRKNPPLLFPSSLSPTIFDACYTQATGRLITAITLLQLCYFVSLRQQALCNWLFRMYKLPCWSPRDAMRQTNKKTFFKTMSPFVCLTPVLPLLFTAWRFCTTWTTSCKGPTDAGPSRFYVRPKWC